MTRDDVISMWNAAGAFDGIDLKNEIKLIEIFAELIAAAEREACAQVCECEPVDRGFQVATRVQCAEAIRARGNT